MLTISSCRSAATTMTNYGQNPRRTSARAGKSAAGQRPPSIGSPFGFHPKLAEVQSLFNQGQLALLANVGTLIRPTTRDQYLHTGRWRFLRTSTHTSAQQQQMQTATLDKFAEVGWGRTAGRQNPIYLRGKFSSCDFAGREQRICRGTGSPADRIERGSHASALGLYGSGEDNARLAALQNLLTFDTGLSLIQSASTTTSNAVQDSQTLATPRWRREQR